MTENAGSLRAPPFFRCSQNPRELERFIELLQERNVRSYLEIGARGGDTFYKVMKSLPNGSKGVAVDLPNGPWGSEWTDEALELCLQSLPDYDVQMILGDSTSTEVIERVKDEGPYDCVFIDGDHRYETVEQDWINYRTKITAFHDIAGRGLTLGKMTMGVPELWDQLKMFHEHIEIIEHGDRPFGIGVIL